MDKTFVEMITFQVKPERIAEFEEYVKVLKAEQAAQWEAKLPAAQMNEETGRLEPSVTTFTRELTLGSVPCFFLGMNGMCDLQTIFFLFAEIEKKNFPPKTADSSALLPQFIKDQFLYAQITFSTSPKEMIQNLLSGPCLLLMDGYEQALIIDTGNVALSFVVPFICFVVVLIYGLRSLRFNKS